MPIITSSYRAPAWLPGGHCQTIFPALLRRVPKLPFVRSRFVLADGDAIWLDRLYAGPGKSPSKKGVLILSHGLEGDARRPYMRGMCLAALSLGLDCLGRNCRSCGGEMNLLPGMYHSGQTEDLRQVVKMCVEEGHERIFLAGFSMGGNQTLKYLGEEGGGAAKELAAAVVFSVPCDLAGSARVLDRPGNALYMRNFLKTLREKVRRKHALFPLQYPLDKLEAMRTFAEFDAAYTAPLHGFASAEDYWRKASCLPWLEELRLPTLLVNAGNDPFLSPGCYPAEAARRNPFLHLEIPEQGGHVGFVPAKKGRYWSEERALAFFCSEGGA